MWAGLQRGLEPELSSPVPEKKSAQSRRCVYGVGIGAARLQPWTQIRPESFHPLMSDFFPCFLFLLLLLCCYYCCYPLRKASCASGFTPVSSLHASFSSRWDEFGQTRRGRESSAAPRRGLYVSIAQNSKRQSRHFRELKQRVFRHRVGRYTDPNPAPFLQFIP